MKQLKKTLLTLVALLAVTTGAWAETGENIFQYCYDCQRSPAYPKTTASASLSGFANPLVGYKGSGFEAENTSAGPWKLEYMGLWSTTDNHGIDDVSYYQYTYSCTDVPVFRLYQWNATANEYQHASYGVVCAYAKVSNAVEHTAFFEAADGWGCVLTNSSHSSSMNITFDEDLTTGLTNLIAAASSTSGPEVAWDEAKKTGTFTMPGGNVTLEPEYYPQATVADGGVTAADADARATTDDPLVKVDATKLTGAKKLMYFVSNSGTTAPAYDAEGWTDQLPTAEGFTQQGIVYVWYYPVGTDEGVDGATATYSDGDICLQSITARIAAAPTYAVTFAEGTDPNEWTAEPATGVKKGETVTVTYSGTKKVIGVKAEKKAAPTYTLLSAATTEDYGKVVCAAGHLHDAKTAVPDGCTAVGILGKVTETGHGLILALQYTFFQEWNTINGWNSVTSYAGTTLKVLPDDARDTDLSSYTALGETAVSNWAVAQKSDYEAIFTNLGSTTGTISDGKTYDGNVNAYITTGVGGTAMSGEYWSATDNDDDPWYFDSYSWSNRDKSQSNGVWPVLGF